MTKDEKDRRKQLRLNKPLTYEKVMNYEKQLANGKSIAMIQFNPSYVCNLHCKHCSVSSFRKQKKKILTIEEIGKLYNDAHRYGLAQTDITGGEPLAFKNIFDIIKAIGTRRFYTTVATNGWFLNEEMAIKLKQSGVDRVLISLDSLDKKSHDAMRGKEGIWQRAVNGIKYSIDNDLDVKLTTVITHDRTRSKELKDFIKFAFDNGARPEALAARTVGEWSNRSDLLLTLDDYKYLEDKYGLQFHTSPHYGMHLGCIAVKKLLSITAFGDVMPCIWMYYSLGNIRDESLENIINKSMNIFGSYHKLCRIGQDKKFMNQYNLNTKGKELPVPIEEVICSHHL